MPNANNPISDRKLSRSDAPGSRQISRPDGPHRAFSNRASQTCFCEGLGQTRSRVNVFLNKFRPIFATRYFVDLSYRYGRISAKTVIPNDTAISTQRVQVGIGIRF